MGPFSHAFDLESLTDSNPDKARRTVERLMDGDMFSGWGIRTLSTKERNYNPIGYHLGTVWPFDNSLIAAGFKPYGFDEAACHGRAIVPAFAKRGASIGLLASRGDGLAGLEGTHKEVEAAGGRALVLTTNVADADQVEAAAARVEEIFGPIGIWINDAMTSVFSSFKGMTLEEFKLALAAKIGFDAIQASILTVDQVTKQKTLCIWCLLAAGATFASVPLVIPESYAALRRLLRKVSC
jgi:short chain dehydrogenase